MEALRVCKMALELYDVKMLGQIMNAKPYTIAATLLFVAVEL